MQYIGQSPRLTWYRSWGTESNSRKELNVDIYVNMYSANDALKASKENNEFIKNHIDNYNNTKKADKFYVLSDIRIELTNFRTLNLS